MNLPDSFYIALCMTVLLVGAVYWVWTQIQYVQRKVNVLENIVYELKTLCSAHPPSPDLYDMPSTPTQANVPAPYTEIDTTTSLLHQTLRQEIEMLQKQEQQIQQDSLPTPMQEEEKPLDEQHEEEQEQEQGQEQGPAMFVMEDEGLSAEAIATDASDLQPGGVGSGLVDTASALESMTLKELKRLAQQRGVVGYSEMKKREIITALRAMPSDGFSEM